MSGRLRRLVGFALTATDQVAFSLQSLLVTVLLARGLEQQRFADFSLVLTVHFVGLTLVRTVTANSVLHFHGGDRIEVAARTPFTLIAAAGLGLVSVLVTCGVASGVGLGTGQVLLLLAALALQPLADAGRYLLHAQGDPRSAAHAGLASLMVFIGGWAVASRGGGLEAASATLLALGLGTFAAVVVVLVRLVSRPNVLSSPSRLGWWSANLSTLRHGSWLTMETVVVMLASQGILFVLALAGTPADVAGYRLAATVALGIPATLVAGVAPTAVVRIRRAGDDSLVEAMGTAARIQAAMAVLVIASALLFLLLPTSIVRALLGENGEQSYDFVIPAAAVIIATSGGAFSWVAVRMASGSRPAALWRIAIFGLSYALFAILQASGALSASAGVAAFAVLVLAGQVVVGRRLVSRTRHS